MPIRSASILDQGHTHSSTDNEMQTYFIANIQKPNGKYEEKKSTLVRRNKKEQSRWKENSKWKWFLYFVHPKPRAACKLAPTLTGSAHLWSWGRTPISPIWLPQPNHWSMRTAYTGFLSLKWDGTRVTLGGLLVWWT